MPLKGDTCVLAIDTNVFARIFVEDDEMQSRKAKNFIQNYSSVFVSCIVFCEAIWLFKSHFKLDKSQIISIVEKILKTRQFQFEYRDALWHAFHEYQHSAADLTDCIIGAVSKLYECDAVVTFDKNAAKSKNFKLI